MTNYSESKTLSINEHLDVKFKVPIPGPITVHAFAPLWREWDPESHKDLIFPTKRKVELFKPGASAPIVVRVEEGKDPATNFQYNVSLSETDSAGDWTARVTSLETVRTALFSLTVSCPGISLFLVRPSLGQPLILLPYREYGDITSPTLGAFEVTVAAEWEQLQYAPGKFRKPTREDIFKLVTNLAPRVQIHNGDRTISLHVLAAVQDEVYLYKPSQKIKNFNGLASTLNKLGLPLSCQGVDELLDMIDRKDSTLKGLDTNKLRELCIDFPLPDNISQDDYHYAAGFRWEYKLWLGVDSAATPLLALPTIASLQIGDKVNYHALFITKKLPDPKNLQFLHWTDTHVAIRNDMIPDIVGKKEIDRLEKWRFLTRYCNPNENLRAAIRDANKRAKEGKLDFIVLTGDIVAYAYDSKWLTAGNPSESNFKKFIQIITGEDVAGERLKIPIFIVPGNHEYYRYLTPLMAHIDANIQDDIPLVAWIFGFVLAPPVAAILYSLLKDIGKDQNTFADYGFRDDLADKERARRVDQYYGIPETIELDGNAPFKVLTPRFGSFTEYLQTINYDLDFSFHIEPHTFGFINTGPEMIFFKSKYEFDKPKDLYQKHVVAGHPDSRGLTCYQLDDYIRNWQVGENGRLFVFTHSPFILLHGYDDKMVRPPIRESLHKQLPPPPNIVTAWLAFTKGKVVRFSYPLHPERHQALIDYLLTHIGAGPSQVEIIKLKDEKNPSSILNIVRNLWRTYRGQLSKLDLFVLDSYKDIQWDNPAEAEHPGWEPPLKTLVDGLISEGYPQWKYEYFHRGLVSDVLPVLDFGAACGDVASLLNEAVGKGQRGSKRFDLVLSGHTHGVHEFRIEQDFKNKSEYKTYTLDYSKQSWRNDLTPIFATSGTLMGSVPRFREIEVTAAGIRYPIRELPAPNNPATYGIEHLFGVASVYLARIGGFANPSRNDLRPCVHVLWAQSTGSRIVVMIDLLEKYNELFKRLEKRRSDLASAYTTTTLWLNGFGLDFGDANKNSMDAALHKTWASKAKVEDIFEETCNRVERVFAFADKTKSDNHNLLSMWFANESIYLRGIHKFNNPARDNPDPASHLGWALSVPKENVIKDLQEKYDLVLTWIKNRKKPDKPALIPAELSSVQNFYANTAARLAAWGVRCVNVENGEPADYDFFMDQCDRWSEEQIRTALRQRIADFAAVS